MQGLGFLLWQLKQVLPIERTVATLQSIGTNWVSIKMLDGSANFNLIDSRGKYTGDEGLLREFIRQLRAAGIDVGGWGFLYSGGQTRQAQRAAEMVSSFGLSHWLIDAEEVTVLGAYWKSGDNRKAEAAAYMNALSMPPGVEVALCSYRFPSLHPEFPFQAFLSSARMTANAPQMYWMGASNSGAQLRRSHQENKAIRDLPLIPIGVTAREHGWEPDGAQLTDFIQTAKALGLPGYGFWDLDEVLYRADWLESIRLAHAGQTTPPPPPPANTGCRVLRVQSASLNIREQPTTASRVLFSVSKDQPLEVLDEVTEGGNIWARVGQRQYAALYHNGFRYLA